VKARDLIQPEPRKQAEINRLYEKLIARVALRTLAEAFDVAPPTLVGGIVFNGYVSAKDRATGKPVRPLLISVQAMRDAFAEIVLDEPELDPKACLKRYLNAMISPHPYDLEPVEPVLKFDLSKYKFVEEMDVIAGLDSRPDLLALTPGEFEHLTRRLFEAMGMASWKTQDSKDDGVDAVAVNEDPIVGGLCIIQAKRYSKIVGVEAVHASGGRHGRQECRQGCPGHHVLGGQGQPGLRRPQRQPDRDYRGPSPEVPAQGTPRARRADQPAQAAARLGAT